MDTRPQLKFFQEVGRDFLAGKTRAILADQMRLGKTPQAITACEKVGARKILVICPAIAQTVWREHFREWMPLNGINIRIVSYDRARMYPENLKTERWDVLICDESHFLKSMEAKRTKMIFGKDGIAWYADRIWCLSGTPAPNHAGELWVTLRVFGAIKTTYWEFIQYFCQVNAEGKPFGTKTEHIPELRAILGKFTLRRLKKDVAPELPECTLESWPVESSERFLDAIRPIEHPQMVKEAMSQAARLKEALSKLPKEKHAQYLMEHADNYVTLRRINAILKTPAVFDTIVFEITNHLVDKLVIFCYHREPIKLLGYLLPDKGVKTEIIYGGTPQKKRDAALARFARPVAKGGSHVIVCQILAAGLAIDLSAAHEGIAVEEDWVPGNNAQAFERMGGYKQTQPIMIRKAVLPGGVDADIEAVLSRKERELSTLFD